ncbi:hypothetical protein P692DRAFT_20735210 [Suillus brevipes Sb2]|nr:hypothetical protein P692DRAFT_20735210 [Suillus brevipes Sb2]
MQQGDTNTLNARRFRLNRASARLTPIVHLYGAFCVTTAPLHALSRLTFVFAFPSRLSSARPVLSLYDPLCILGINLYSLHHNHCATLDPPATSSLEKILRDLHATSASSLPPIVRLLRLAVPPTSRVRLSSH